MPEFSGPATRLSQTDIEAEAAAMSVEPAVVRAVCDVESAGSGFLSDGRPKILFEAHIFYRLTGGKFGVSNISSPSWNRSLYGASGSHQYERLAQAISLNRAAALQSASWGMFQVLGSNYKLTQCRDVEEFVSNMVTGERAHLSAFTKFCESSGLLRFLRSEPPDFASFARGYNGPGYAANSYDTKLAAAWRKYWNEPGARGNSAPRTEPTKFYGTLQLGSYGAAVGELQRQLGVAVDGDFGPVTMAAVVSFQRSAGLVADGIVGPATRKALAEWESVNV